MPQINVNVLGVSKLQDEISEQAAIIPTRARESVARGIVVALQGRGSYWPVDTGYSKSRFGYSLGSLGASIRSQIRITNSAPYAQYVERRPGKGRKPYPARRTIARSLPRIIRDVQRNKTFIREFRQSKQRALDEVSGIPGAGEEYGVPSRGVLFTPSSFSTLGQGRASYEIRRQLRRNREQQMRHRAQIRGGGTRSNPYLGVRPSRPSRRTRGR